MFMAADCWRGFSTSPVTQHRYLFASGAPSRFTDPSGLTSEEDNWKWEAPDDNTPIRPPNTFWQDVWVWMKAIWGLIWPVAVTLPVAWWLGLEVMAALALLGTLQIFDFFSDLVQCLQFMDEAEAEYRAILAGLIQQGIHPAVAQREARIRVRKSDAWYFMFQECWAMSPGLIVNPI